MQNHLGSANKIAIGFMSIAVLFVSDRDDSNMNMRRALRKVSGILFSETVRALFLGEGRQMRPREADAKSSRECQKRKVPLYVVVAGSITFPFGKVMLLFGRAKFMLCQSIRWKKLLKQQD